MCKNGKLLFYYYRLRFLTFEKKAIIISKKGFTIVNKIDATIRFTVPNKNVLGCPNPGDTTKEFPSTFDVFALYPNSTCFYGAKVGVSANFKLPSYQLAFEDDGYFTQYIEARNNGE
ncbi:hypothetical protein Glove_216g196 [Diversispora epigaea]|uniref:SGF29 C-terminal domain-containing protein n=1 Tax=Diversispora epigaea TaxID=1348612 RepID=A0A397IH99_9GLOM|nr:hypothetical protein Glove_216g196 [Diversispora epigaea]